MSFGGQTPTIIVLKEGTDSSQGKGQIISNIDACLAVQSTIRSTLGPYGGDLLLVDGNGKQTITNDGATVMKLLDIVHPAARILTDIARSQDAEVGDGTTSVVVLAGEILKEIKDHVEQGVSSQTIIKGLRRASHMAVNKIMDIAVDMREGDKREILGKLAATAMSSKLIKRNSEFFTKMVVDAVLSLDQDDLNEKLIGVKKIQGGALQDSLFVDGVAFKKTFSYAGFEQQPKSFKDPKIVCLNVELELKSEKDNAEVRVEQVSEYQAIVDAEWQIIYNKMEALHKTGAKVVLSKLPIGDLATQYFADRDVFCAGRVTSDDLERVIQATGGSIQSTCSDIQPQHLGTCEKFEERQIGGERFNFFEGCPAAKTCTLVLRGGAEQFIAEVERSLHDAIMIVKRSIKNNNVVAGGGACEMEISAFLHAYADTHVRDKQQSIIKSFAKALEIIPRQLCDNAGFDATDILNKLRVEHRRGNIWAGVDFDKEGVRDNLKAFVWEPSLVKINAIQAAVEASCLILSVDETIKNEESQQPGAQPQRALPPGAAQRALGMGRGRGRGMPRR
ncbi:MAG: T-complex protein 1 subunit eta [Vezdaea acicularis]|nr:MAG: T-complex protein 1 subunit eta [Vezdaea acicularis]